MEFILKLIWILVNTEIFKFLKYYLAEDSETIPVSEIHCK